MNGSREGPSHKRRATQILCSRVATRRANLLGPKAHPRHVTVNVSFANQGNRDTPPSSSLKLTTCSYMIEHVVVDSSPPDAELVNVICELIMV